MSWSQLPHEIRDTAETVLTGKQLEAWKLELAGLGTRRSAEHLNLSRTTVVDRLNTTYRKLTAAGITQDASGNWHQREDAP